MTAAGGPPVRLLTHSQRVRRRRVIAMQVAIVVVFAVTLTVLLLRIVTRPDANVSLGATTFEVGEAEALDRRIRADRFPLLFQDLRDKSIDLFVLRDTREPDVEAGWLAIEAHAPDAPRTCQLRWIGAAFRDPCDGTTYPSTGEGLRRFEVNVVDGVIYVDFRDVSGP